MLLSSACNLLPSLGPPGTSLANRITAGLWLLAVLTNRRGAGQSWPMGGKLGESWPIGRELGESCPIVRQYPPYVLAVGQDWTA